MNRIAFMWGAAALAVALVFAATFTWMALGARAEVHAAIADLSSDFQKIFEDVRSANLSFNDQDSLIDQDRVELKSLEAGILCGWQNQAESPREVIVDTFRTRGGHAQRQGVKVFRPAGDPRCGDGVLPALYAAIHVPMPSGDQISYVEIEVGDKAKTHRWGVRINPREPRGEKKDPSWAVTPYRLDGTEPFDQVSRAQPKELGWWRPEPRSTSLGESIIIVRLNPNFYEVGRTARQAYLREFANRNWTITARYQSPEREIISLRTPAVTRKPLSVDELLLKIEPLAPRKCFEVRFVGEGETTEWRRARSCSLSSSTNGDWLMPLLLGGALDWDATPSTLVSLSNGDERQLEIRVPESKAIEAANVAVGKFVTQLRAHLSLVAATILVFFIWYFFRSYLFSRRVKLLARAASDATVPLPQMVRETEVLQPLVEAVRKERETAAQEMALARKMHAVSVQDRQQTAFVDEQRKAYQRAESALRHELTSFVGSSLMELPDHIRDRKGGLAFLLDMAKVAKVVIDEIGSIGARRPFADVEPWAKAKEVLSIDSLIKQWLELQSSSATKEVSTRVFIKGEILCARGPALFVLNKFLDNAIEHAKPLATGPRVRVGIRRMTSKGYIAITLTNVADPTRQWDPRAAFGLVRRELVEQLGEAQDRLSQPDGESLRGLGLFAAGQYALMTHGLVDCRFKSWRGCKILSFSLALKMSPDSEKILS